MALVILDTSIFCGAILSQRPDTACPRVVASWMRGEFTIAVTPEIEREYREVLARREFRDRPLSGTILQRLDAGTGVSRRSSPSLAALVRARDPNDQMYLDLGASCASSVVAIVSNDNDLLASPKGEVAVASPGFFLRALLPMAPPREVREESRGVGKVRRFAWAIVAIAVAAGAARLRGCGVP